MDFARYWRLLWGFFLVDWKPNRETGLFTLLTVAVVLAPRGHQSSCGQFQCNTDTLCRVFPIIVIVKLCHLHCHRDRQTCWQKKPWCQSYYCILWPWRANKSVIVDKVTWTLNPTRNIHNGSWTIIFQWEVLGAFWPQLREVHRALTLAWHLCHSYRYRYGSVSLMHSLCKPRTS